MIESAGDDIWGIAVNTSKASCGDTDRREVFERALEMAERTGRPFLFGTRFDDDVWPLADQLAVLRPGDVVTYCLQKDPRSIVRDGRVAEEVWEAREHGVLFDVGHGMMSLDFDTAEVAIADGFLPDTISTDFYKRHLGADPPHDMPRTVSKLIAAGVPEGDAFTRATLTPARTLNLEGEIGTLRPGACADLAIIRWNDDAPPLTDTSGNTRPGGSWEPVATVRAGRVVGTASPSECLWVHHHLPRERRAYSPNGDICVIWYWHLRSPMTLAICGATSAFSKGRSCTLFRIVTTLKETETPRRAAQPSGNAALSLPDGSPYGRIHPHLQFFIPHAGEVGVYWPTCRPVHPGVGAAPQTRAKGRCPLDKPPLEAFASPSTGITFVDDIETQ